MRLLSLNAHKALSPVWRAPVLPALRDALVAEDPDIVCLQEVIGAPPGADGPASQCERLAAGAWPFVAYGYTATNAAGPFGNGVLSKFPIVACDRADLSGDRGEPRGAVHCILEVAGTPGVHVVSVHLGLLNRLRLDQIEHLSARVLARVPEAAPLVVAGDFNDWWQTVDRALTRRTGMREAFATLHGGVARTWPSALPVLGMDRVYLRNLEPTRADAGRGRPWSRLSDHAPLVVDVSL